MIRFDADTRTVSLSVRDLADESDYRFAGPAPLSLKRRALLGRLAHEDHQGAREAEIGSYRRERGVRFETEAAGWRVVVSGRIDGIYTDPAGRTVIEEVKTIVGTRADLEAASPDTFPHYTRQLQLYRFLLEEGSQGLAFGTEGAPEIALHLHLIALPGKEERTLDLGYDRAACRALVQRRLEEIVGDQEARQGVRERRRDHLRDVPFPHQAARIHQHDMMEAIARGLEGPGRVLVSAPPGIGKTAGALIPALRHAAARGGRVFVATSKTTQQRMFADTVRLIREAGAPVRAVVLTAREKGCLNDVVSCRPETCRYADDYAGKLTRSGAADRLRRLPVVGREALAEEGRAHGFCPVEAALDLTAEVDVVIGDYNYVFDPGAALRRMFVEEDPDDVVLVIDEAHDLLDRGCAYYSPELRRDDVVRLERALAGAGSPVLRRVRDVLRRLADLVAAVGRGASAPAAAPAEEQVDQEPAENMLLFDDPHVRPRKRRPARAAAAPVEATPLTADEAAPILEGEVAVDPAPFAALRDELSELAVAWFAEGRAEARAEAGDAVPHDQDPVLAANRLLGRFVGVLELGGEELTTVSRRRDGGTLKVLCTDASRYLGRRIRACAGAVAVSATLQPLEFYRDVLGFGPDAALHAFPSPFDPARRKVIVLDLPSTTYERRERDLPIVVDGIRAVVAARRGNYIVGCPSFADLPKLGDAREPVPGFELIRQARYMPEESRAQVLQRLRDVHTRGLPPVVLLVVLGGIFTEGVDYPGDTCIGAVVVGPGLPQVSLERELVQRHFQRTYGRGFEYAFLYPGMNKVIQAAGRVIRTPTDRGVVVLVGSRFATPRYASLLPRDWYREHPRELICADPYGDLVRFWEETDA